jgi:hypothetical protein
LLGAERVVCALPRKVVEVGAAKVRERRPAAGDLEPRRTQQQAVQFSRRRVPLRTWAAEPRDPRLRHRVERDRDACGDASSRWFRRHDPRKARVSPEGKHVGGGGHHSCYTAPRLRFRS